MAAGQGRVHDRTARSIGILKRSRPNLPEPDLFIFGLPGYFKGYEPGYSEQVRAAAEPLHVGRAEGLHREHRRSRDPPLENPRAWPLIEFRYFSEGNDQKQATSTRSSTGVDFARKMNDKLSGGRGHSEIVPGPG